MADDDTTDEGADVSTRSDPRVPPRPSFDVNPMEVEAVQLVPVAAHPDTVFDDDELRMLLARTFSLTIVEKINILVNVSKFTREQVDSLVEILRGDQAEFERLNARHAKRLADLEQKHAAEWQEAGGKPEPSSTRDLTGGEKAGLVYRATPRLLAPVGKGDANKFFAAFLQRLAWRIEQGDTAVIEGELPTIFEPELRNPELNPRASDPASDMRLINALVRPALSRLRKAAPVPLVHKTSAFVIALVIEGPERPGGRVKQHHRVGVLMTIDSYETKRLVLKWQFIRQVVAQLRSRRQDVVDLEDLGAFAPIVRRVVEQAGYKSDADRAELTFDVTRYVVGDILATLKNEQRLQFLLYILKLPIRWSGTVPTTDFENWFLNAVELNDGLKPGDEDFDYGVGRFQSRLRYASFGFATKVLLLKAYHLAPGPQRMGLLAQLAFLDEGRMTEIADGDQLSRPPATINLHEMLEGNVTDVSDFLRLVEAKTLDFLNE